MKSKQLVSSRRNSYASDNPKKAENEIVAGSIMKRRVLSRITRYDFDDDEQSIYDKFVTMLSTFDFGNVLTRYDR